MKFFRLDLLTLLISLFILNSCKNKETIGLPLDSSNQLSGNLIDTATIVVNTVPEDSVITSGLTKTPLGYFNDPILGTTESNIAVLLNLPGNTSYSLPAGQVIVDSALLVLKYANGFYGDSTSSKYKINVYQLNKRVSANQPYYSTFNWDSLANKSNLLGTRTFFARTHDSIRINSIITGGPDSLVRVPPQLRVPISKDFVNQVLFNASGAQLGSNTIFNNNVKGLYITLDKTGTTGPGGIFMLDLADSLNVYYRTINGSTIDTAMTGLPISNGSAQIRHTRSAAVNTELSSKNTSRNVIYLQGLAGLKAKISFPYLKNIAKTIGSNIVINRAELVVSPSPETIIPFMPQSKLTMYRYDLARQPVEVQDAGIDPRGFGTSAFGGFYNATNRTYHFLITAYISDLMSGKSVDYGTYLAPVDYYSTSPAVDILPTPETAGRTIAVGTDKNSPYRIRLNIIYTKVTR